MTALAESDSRIKFIRREENGHISAASNTALSMATGSWVACLDHDDRLADSALAHFALAIVESPAAGLIYSDEDKISQAGSRQDPFFKPEFDPLLLLGQNFLCHLSMYKKDLIDQIGGFREGYEGSQDWDLALRVTANLPTNQIRHIPRILYHWRIHPGSTAQSLTSKSYAANAGERAVRDHVESRHAQCDVISLPASGWNRVRWHLPSALPLVSIVIPTRDGKLLSRCIESIRNRSTYGNYEIIVVDNGSLSRDTLEYLRANDSSITVIRDESTFNYPDINNRAVERSHGEVICLLNDDTEVLGGDWLEELVGQLLQPSIGVVGAKLYYSNGQVQHAGVILGIGGVAGHAYRMSDRLSTGDHGRMQLPHQLSAVTAACMVVRREAWVQVGGMDAKNLPVAFNDIDFCLRLREAGWSIAWTPFAELIHHESISRGLDTEGERAVRFAGETHYMKQRWGSALRNDPFYNPNLTMTNERFELAWPPRLPRI
jgi:GT2 family glycosyltransferase